MYKIFTSLVAICCCLSFARTASAQVSFSIVPTELQSNVQVGDTVTVNVDVDEFYGIASYQFSINWNPTWLNFESVHNLSLPNMTLGGNFGTNNVGNGQLTTLWSAPGGGFFSLWDGDTTIFSVDFIIATTEGITAPISITNNPTGIEVIADDGNGGLADITSSVIINNGTATESPTGTGPTCNFAGGFGQIIEDASGTTGDVICMPVYSCGFTNIVSAQYSVNFDPSILQFSSTGNYNLPGLDANAFNGNNSLGFITFSWLDSLGLGVTVADTTALYEICYTIVGGGGSTDTVSFSDSPLMIEITDSTSNGAHIGFGSEFGVVTVTGNSGSAVTIVASDEIGPVGGQACVQITGLNFDSIVGIQYDMHWDTSIIQYASLGNFAPFLNNTFFNTTPTFTDAGTMILSYNGPGGAPVSIMNGDTLYEVCFDIVGDIGEISPFYFDGTPLAIEVTQQVDGVDEMVPLVTQAGEVEVIGDGIFTLTASDEEGCPGDTVYVDYLASNFNALVSMQYDVTYDPAVLEFVGQIDLLPELNAMNISNLTPGEIKLSWAEGGNNQITYPTDTVIYRFCFIAIGADGTNSTISWDYADVIEITDGSVEVPYIFNDGSVNVTNSGCGPQPPNTPTANITDIDCFGDTDGAIDITATGGTPGYTYEWSTADGSGLVPTDEDQTGLTAGTYTVTVTDTTPLTSTASFTVGGPAAALSTTITPVDATCDGGSDGSATANPAGGTAPYTYLWDNAETTPSISNLPAGQVCVTITDDNGCTENACITIGDGNAITVNIDITNSNCTSPTGALTANPTGGSGTFNTYSWNTNPIQTTQTATGLAPGNYCVIVTDSDGCTKEECENVGTLSGPTGTITDMQQTTCSTTTDGSLTVSATGGTGAYTYTWSTNPVQNGATATNLIPGFWTVTIEDAAGCEDVVTGEVVAGAGPSVSVNDSEASCDTSADGVLTASPSGGTGPYNYAWNTNPVQNTATATGLAPGTYMVTLTDTASGCTDTETANVTAGAGISVSVANDATSCVGSTDGELTAVPSNGSGTYTYLWSNGTTANPAVNLSAATYTVTVTDMTTGCTEVETATVSSPSAVTASASVTSNYNGQQISCDGGADGTAMATPGGGTGSYTYAWSTSPSQTGQVATGLQQGTYTVTITDTNSCSQTAQVTLTDPTAISLTATVTNETAGGDGAVNTTVSGGVSSYTYLWSANANNATSPDIAGLTEGEYCVTVTDANNCTATGCYTVNGPNALTVTLVSTTDESCYQSNDGEIEITNSGTGSFTYAWNPSLPNTNNPITATQGTYSVTVTDTSNGVQGVLSGITVGGPADPISYTVDKTNVSCNGNTTGSIGLTVSGGNGGAYVVEWGGSFPNGPTLSNLPAGSYTPTITDNNNCTLVGTPIDISEPTSMAVQLISTVNPGCNGELTGEIHISVSGGTAPYVDYAWTVAPNTPINVNSPDLTGLGAGIFSCIITDANGCMASIGQIELQQIASPVISIVTQINPLCAGESTGAIDISVADGQAPYTFNWEDLSGTMNSEDRAGIPAGDYNVTVTDANGCTDIAGPITITEPDPIQLSTFFITPATSAGNDGQIDMNDPIGGTGAYTYVWTDEDNIPFATSLDITGLTSGVYTLVATDANGCTEDITVTVAGDLTISPVTITHVSCAGDNDGAINISIFGGVAPYSYLWNTGASVDDLFNLIEGSYTVTVTDVNGLSTTGTYEVLGPDLLVIGSFNITHETGNGCNGAIDINVTGGTGQYTYLWSNGKTSEDINLLCKGNYQVTVTDINGCILVSPSFAVLPPPISVANSSTQMASCNGAADGSYCISVFGGCEPYVLTLGTTVINSLTGSQECFTGLAAGNYQVTITDSDGSTNTQDITTSFTITEPDPVVVNIVNQIDNTGGDNCNGAINITTTGGTPQYSYIWSNGETSEDINMLCGEANNPDPYSVTVTDSNGCIGTLEDINIYDSPVVTATVKNVSCFDDCDGNINTAVSFGAGPYIYSWSTGGTGPGISSLCPGAYSLTVTDVNGYTVQATYNINAPSSELNVEVVSFTSSNGSNADGSINIGVTGGWGNYEYLWNTGATSMDVGGLLGGQDGATICYTVTVTDGGGCEFIQTQCIVANDIFITNQEVVEENCAGEENGYICIETAGGTLPHSYQWNNGLGNDACIYDIGAGHYEVTVVDASGNLIKVFEWDMEGKDSLSVNFTTGAGTATAIASGGTEPYQYIWNNTQGDVGPMIKDQPTGTYYVVITDSNGCTLTDQIDITIEIDGECSEARTILTPNDDFKNEEFIILCARVFPVDLEVFNRWGQKVYEASNYDNTWRGTDSSGNILPEGGYYYVVSFTDPKDGKDKQTKGYLTILID